MAAEKAPSFVSLKELAQRSFDSARTWTHDLTITFTRLLDEGKLFGKA